MFNFFKVATELFEGFTDASDQSKLSPRSRQLKWVQLEDLCVFQEENG